MFEPAPPKVFSFGKAHPRRVRSEKWRFDVLTCKWTAKLAKMLMSNVEGIHPASGLLVSTIKAHFLVVYDFLKFIEENAHSFYSISGTLSPDCMVEYFVAAIHSCPTVFDLEPPVQVPGESQEDFWEKQVAHEDFAACLEWVATWDHINYQPPAVIPRNPTVVQYAEGYGNYCLEALSTDPAVALVRDLGIESSNFPTGRLVNSLVHNKELINKKIKAEVKKFELKLSPAEARNKLALASASNQKLTAFVATKWEPSTKFPLEYQYGTMMVSQGDNVPADFFSSQDRGNYMLSMFGPLTFKVLEHENKLEEHGLKMKEYDKKFADLEARLGIHADDTTAGQKRIKLENDNKLKEVEAERDEYKKILAHQLGGRHLLPSYKAVMLEGVRNKKLATDAVEMVAQLKSENFKLKRQREEDPDTQDEALTMWLETRPKYTCRKTFHLWLKENNLEDRLKFSEKGPDFSKKILNLGYHKCDTAHAKYGYVYQK